MIGSSAPPRALIVGWLATAALAVYLVFVGGSWAGIYLASLRSISLVLILAVLGTWAIVAVRNPSWRPGTALWPAVVLGGFAYAIATVTSRFPGVSVEYFAWAVLVVALYLLLVRLLREPFFRARIGVLIVALSAAVGVLYLVAIMGWWLEWWSLVGRVVPPPLRPSFESLTFGNPSAVLTMAVLLCSAAAAYVGFSSGPRRVAVWALGLLTLAVVVLSGSRAGWLALAAGVAVSVVAWLATSAGRDAIRELVRDPRARRGIGLLVLIGAAVSAAVGPGILNRLGAGGESLRVAYLSAAGRMYIESPLVGTGPGSWVIQRLTYTEATEPDFYIPHAHNVYAQTVTEFGLPGLVAGVALLAGLVWLIRDATTTADLVRRRFGWAAIFSLAYFAAHHFLDFYMNMPAALFAVAVPVAWLDATADRRMITSPAGRWSPAVPALGLALLCAAGFVLVRSEVAAGRVDSAVRLANDNRWADALPLLEDVAGEREIGAYQLTLGLALARGGDRVAAAEAFRSAANLDDLPKSWLNLAAESLELGNTEQVGPAIQRALRLGIQRPGIALPAGDLALRSGDVDTAHVAFTEAIFRAPTLAGDDWWESRPELATARDDAMASVLTRVDAGTAILILLEADRADDAVERAATLPPEIRPEYDRLILAWNGDPNAFAEMVAEARADPIGNAVSVAALVATHIGDRDMAADLKRWADIRYAGTDPLAYEVRVAPPNDPDVFGYGLASFYGHYTYRRPTPWNLLVPSLPHLELR